MAGISGDPFDAVWENARMETRIAESRRDAGTTLPIATPTLTQDELGNTPSGCGPGEPMDTMDTADEYLTPRGDENTPEDSPMIAHALARARAR